MITGEQARALFRKEIQKAFAALQDKRRGGLAAAGAEIGIPRQAIQQYADGSVPGADVILTALLRWGWRLRIEDPAAKADEPQFWDCAVKRVGRTPASKQALPVQLELPLVKAIEDLQDRNVQVSIVRKGPGSIELSLGIAFPKRVV